PGAGRAGPAAGASAVARARGSAVPGGSEPRIGRGAGGSGPSGRELRGAPDSVRDPAYAAGAGGRVAPPWSGRSMAGIDATRRIVSTGEPARTERRRPRRFVPGRDRCVHDGRVPTPEETTGSRTRLTAHAHCDVVRPRSRAPAPCPRRSPSRVSTGRSSSGPGGGG